MKLVSFNVNGIRAILKKDFLADVKKMNPDVLCLQETKAHPSQVGMALEEFEHHFWNSAEKKGYAGTAVFSKIKPLSVQYGMGVEELDKEGRVIAVEFDDFFVVTVYTPNAQPGLRRIVYRQSWDKAFLAFVKDLEKMKPVIFCGDLNVARTPIDLARPRENEGSPGYSQQERDGYENIAKAGFLDTFRHFHPEKVQYSWWSYRTKARDRDIGWRIDYFCVSPVLLSRLKSASIRNDIFGSDHCPVELVLKK